MRIIWSFLVIIVPLQARNNKKPKIRSMTNRFLEKAGRGCIALCLFAACGVFTACTDDYDLDDEGNYPSWLGGSIYDAMKNPENLQGENGNVLKGTFNNYLRLIDDLGYAETL